MQSRSVAGRRSRWLAATAVLAAAACTPAAREPVVATPPPAASPAPAPATPPATAPADGARSGYTAADVRFLQHMIGHHAQAIVMTRLVPERAANDRLRALAERIAVSQHDEIAAMQGWLRAHGETAPVVEPGHEQHVAAAHAGMPGMATADELARLAAARGTAFDRLFLELMIRHHEGALVMVRELFASPGAAQDSQLFQIASDVDADQRAEIARMRQLLAALPS